MFGIKKPDNFVYFDIPVNFLRASSKEIIFMKVATFLMVNMFRMKLRPSSVQNPLVDVL